MKITLKLLKTVIKKSLVSVVPLPVIWGTIIIPLLRRRGPPGILFFLCLSIRLSVVPSVHNTFVFVAFFSAIINCSLLIFCIKIHIGKLYCGMNFEIHLTSTSCLPRKKRSKVPKIGTLTIFYVKRLFFIRFWIDAVFFFGFLIKIPFGSMPTNLM